MGRAVRNFSTFWVCLPEDPVINGEIRREQILAMARRRGVQNFANLACALGIAIALWDPAAAPFLSLWVIGHLILAGIRSWPLPSVAELTPEAADRAARLLTSQAFCAGALWAAAPAVLCSTLNLEQNMLLAMVSAGMVAGATGTNAALPLAAAAFILPLGSSVVIAFLREGGAAYATTAVLIVVYILAMLGTTRQNFANFVETILMRFGRDQLAGEITTLKSDLLDAMEAVPEAFALFDREGRLQTANRTFTLLFDLPPEKEAKAMSYEAVIRRRAAHAGFAAPHEDDGRIAREAECFRNADGTHIWQHWSGRWLQSTYRKSRTGGTVCVHIDINDLKEQQQALSAAMLEAEAANRLKSQFLANMSHELRTPLNAIIGFSDLIGSQVNGPVGDETYVDYALAIAESGRHLLGNINDILDLSRAETGQLRLHEGPLDLSELIAAAVETEDAAARNKDLSLVTEIAPGLPLIRGDDRRLGQVIRNLLNNAIRFTPRGGRVTVRAHQDTDDVIILGVQDTGIGIPPEALATVLEPFRQGDGALSRQHGGAGLGLPIARAYMELHQGSLTLDSTEGQGTTVICRLPAERIITVAGTRSAAG